MRKNKIHRADVMAAQNTACPSCGHSITPAEIQRVSTDEMKCPKCGIVFVVGKTTARGAMTRSLFVPSFVDRAQVVMQSEAA